MDISVIIVSWKVPKELRRCLDSLLVFSSNLKLEIIVIDNNSGADTLAMIEEEFPTVKLIANGHNLGFAKAVNQGLKKALGKYILILNPDSEVLPGTLSEMHNFLEYNYGVALVGPKIIYPDGSLQPSVRTFPTLGSQVAVLLKLSKIWPSLPSLRKYLRRDFEYDKQQEVDQIMGAAMFFRRSLINKVGNFDERFYIWFEEVDFCLRIKQAGYRIVYLPTAQIVHHKAASFNQVLPLRRQMIFNKSLIQYFWKNVSPIAALILALITPINFLLTLIYSLIPTKNVN